jgi:hypothetical protein
VTSTFDRWMPVAADLLVTSRKAKNSNMLRMHPHRCAFVDGA